jgi:hypothetical protein
MRDEGIGVNGFRFIAAALAGISSLVFKNVRNPGIISQCQTEWRGGLNEHNA